MHDDGAARWPRAGAPPPLCPGEVHVWLAPLDVDDERLSALRAHLDHAERVRAERPVYPVLRRRWAAARGTLREVLGAYLDVAPDQPRLAYGAYGKPRLVAPAVPLHFNLAHTGGVALIALCADADVGVDVEHEREVDVERVSRRMFAAPERAALFALPEARRRAGFFECWSYKEAFVKAHGDGLTLDTTRFDAWRPGRGEGDRSAVHGDVVDGDWEIEALRPLPAHPAAVCTRGGGWRVVRGEWSP